MTISEDSMNRLIREAFGELCSEEYRPHEEAEPIPVSFPFDLYMEELLDERAKRIIRFRKMGWSSIVILLILALMIFSVVLAKTPSPPSPSEQSFYPGGLLPGPTERLPGLEHTYYIAGLPAEYTLTEKEQSTYAIREVWSDGVHTVERWQSCIGWRSWRGLKSTSERNVVISGNAGKVYRMEPVQGSSLLLVWSNQHYYMELRVLGADKDPSIHIDQLVRWAEGLIQADLYEPEPDES